MCILNLSNLSKEPHLESAQTFILLPGQAPGSRAPKDRCVNHCLENPHSRSQRDAHTPQQAPAREEGVVRPGKAVLYLHVHLVVKGQHSAQDFESHRGGRAKSFFVHGSRIVPFRCPSR